MKLVQEKKKRSKAEYVKQFITTMEESLVFVYLVCMLGIFPLFYKEQYYKIGDTKFQFFWKSSICFIGISLIYVLIKAILKKRSDIGENKDKKYNLSKDKIIVKGMAAEEEGSENVFFKFLENLSSLDYAVFLYAICVVLSYAFSDFKDYALKGAAGWEMGLCSQMIFVAVYFILSRQKLFTCFSFSKKNKVINDKHLIQNRMVTAIFGIHLISSALAFIFGILHRFEIDPLGMYEGLNLNQKIEFLSTIGQATWFSSYVCTVFAAGVTIFYVSKNKGIRILTGIYTAISFGILVTQNSDSAFMAVAGIMLLLGYFSLKDMEKWCRFLQIFCLMWGTFGGIGILQKIFADRAIPLDSLSTFFSQSSMSWILFVISFVILLFYQYFEKGALLEKSSLNQKSKMDKKAVFGDRNKQNADKIMEITKVTYKGFLITLAAGIIAVIVFIYLNTKGYLLTWFGYQNTHPYLYFDYHWGSNRGSTWMICWQAFLEMPLYQKLFGAGPDSLGAYLYNAPEISELLYSLWGNLKLTNAHNEYLNSLLCYGMVGVISWLAVLIGGIRYFYKKAKENPFMIAFALCIMGYACHNIFCYQQVCCTPFLFLVLGIGESLTKSENFNTIK